MVCTDYGQAAMRSVWLTLMILACQSGDKSARSDPADTDRQEDTAEACASETEYPVTWNGWASGFFASYCRSCHSAVASDRRGAPEGVDFDTEADVDRQIDAIWRVVITQERMPVGGGVFPDDLLLLSEYLCARMD